MPAVETELKVEGVLASIERVSGHGAIYQALHEGDPVCGGSVNSFCRLCLNHTVTRALCRFSCCDATRTALSSGEPHFYRCWAGLLFVTVAVAPQNRCCGGIELGGFYAKGEEDDLRATLRERLGAWSRLDLQPFLDRLESVRETTPAALHGLGFLALETTFSSGLNSSDFFRRQNERYVRQRRIAEAYGDIRQAPPSPPDILDDTSRLVSLLHRGEETGATEFAPRYLARLLMASNWDVAKLKAHVRVLLAILTSQDLLRGVPWAAATSRELRRMVRLENAPNTEAVCHEVAEWIQQYFRRRDPEGAARQSLADRLQAWLQAHYTERVTLAAAARAAGASTSTLVHRLRAETGRTFRDMLRGTRIDEARKLLATTALEIADIADRCGFADQSHLTREFKRRVNLTPGQFRALLQVPELALRSRDTHSLDEFPATRHRPTARTDRTKKRRDVSAPPSHRTA